MQAQPRPIVGQARHGDAGGNPPRSLGQRAGAVQIFSGETKDRVASPKPDYRKDAMTGS